MQFRLISTLAALMLALSATAQTSEREYILELTSPDKPVQLEVSVYFGEINIVGFDGKQVEVSVRKTERENPDDNRRKAKADAHTPSRSVAGLTPVAISSSVVAIEEHNNHVEVSAEYSNEYVAVDIRVPRNSSVESQLRSGGSLKVSGINGSLELESWKSPIEALDVSGPIVAETHSEDIVVRFSSLDQANPTSLASHSGNIDISLSQNIKAQVVVQSFRGQLYSGVKAPFTRTDRVEKTEEQEIIIGGHMSAAVNGGGQQISLNTYSGDIYVRQH
ncbi:hypothetical protein [Bowmanella sp. JS7-9]|uniref:Adhesin domain-containing protein n=1 Tax=Pseudobowmanella zhangzhouensis TaxID=1537679 RepID=A0ABW1XHQ5_9ALTE|nr:hypothetical protein [Bowmanella sp. JS7-9]TBX21364.1 hypothetical protein TK45_12480 [Bowmanella sp. JS7-9]